MLVAIVRFEVSVIFDVMLKENNYHRIENLSKEEIMARLLNKDEEGATEDE